MNESLADLVRLGYLRRVVGPDGKERFVLTDKGRLRVERGFPTLDEPTGFYA